MGNYGDLKIALKLYSSPGLLIFSEKRQQAFNGLIMVWLYYPLMRIFG